MRIARDSSNPKITQKDLSARPQILGVMIGDSTIGKIENKIKISSHLLDL